MEGEIINGKATTLLIRLDERMTAMQAQQIDLRNKVDRLTQDVSLIPSLKDAIAEMKPEVEEAKKDRWTRLGVAIGGLGGAAGIASAIKAFFIGASH